jgi:medium-chain acyl-[acyl-carrier-protein] hydrolase
MVEEHCSRLPQLAASACDALGPAMVPPFALFGHSFGALLAFEIARELRRRGAPGPDHLFVSGRRAPRLPEPAPPLHGLPDAEFVAEIRSRFDGIPPAILQEPEILQLLLPALRADMAALETYAYLHEEPLECPITALGGEDDPWATKEELEAWREETDASFATRRFPGAHFYLQQAEPLLLSVLAERLAEAAAAATVKSAP